MSEQAKNLLTSEDIDALKRGRLSILDTTDIYVVVAIRHLFALGCLLVVKGEREAGYKACQTALMTLPLPGEVSRKILTLVDGNETLLAGSFKPHVEILELFKR